MSRYPLAGCGANLVHPGPIDTDMNPADSPAAAEERKLAATGDYGSGGYAA